MKSGLKILAILTMLFIVQPAIAVSFTSRDLGASGPGSSDAWYINDSGTIIGVYGGGHYFIWSKENGVSPLTIPGYNIFEITDFNNQGKIIGRYLCGSCSFFDAFIWSPENGLTDIDISYDTRPEALNNNGVVTGETDAWGNLKGFLWTPSITNLGTLGGDFSYANDINDNNEVVGEGPFSDIYIQHAFIWKNGVMTDLGTIGNTNHSSGLAININGDVAGTSDTPNGGYNATVWMNDSSSRRIIDLGIRGVAFDINDNRQVVGTATGIINRAFYWTEADGLVFLTEPGMHSVAREINNRGQIVGSSTADNRIFNATLWEIDSGENEDLIPPNITINVPNGSYILNQIIAADYSCEDPSGVSVCSGTVPNGSNIDTDSIGTKTFSVIANDTFGNSETRTITYNVAYNFTGFFSPVDNIPTFNKMKAGGAVPVKFSFNGDQGLDIFAPGYPKSTAIACNDVNASEIGANETVTAGQSGLFYDSTLDQYDYIWKTDKSWTGACRQLVMKFDDNTYQRANFEFK